MVSILFVVSFVPSAHEESSLMTVPQSDLSVEELVNIYRKFAKQNCSLQELEDARIELSRELDAAHDRQLFFRQTHSILREAL